MKRILNYDEEGFVAVNDNVVSIGAITGINVPETGGTPARAIAATTQYSGTVTWAPAVSGTFAAETAYTATITLTAKTGFTLQGVSANFFTVAGAAASNAANSGVVTAVFPATGGTAENPLTVNIAAIMGIRAPVTGEAPVTAIAETVQYSGTVSWAPAVSGTFAAETAYTATITLTAKTGFTLQGVSENFFTVAGAIATNAVDSGVITAVFPTTIPIYTVSFDSNGGSVVASQYISEGGTVSRPTNPTKSGFGFVNWYSNADLTNPPYDFNTPVTGDITLYAQWSTTFYTVAFESNGGEPVDDQSVGEGGTASRPVPSRDDYEFGDWYRDPGLTILYDFDTPVTDHVTLYAKWIPVYTVSFNSNDGSPVNNQPVVEGSKASRPSNPTRIGYTFDNWYSNPELSTLYNFDDPVTGNITLYAKWIYTVNDPFTISFTQVDDAAENLIVNQVISISGNNGPKTATLMVDNSEQYSSIEWYEPITGVSGNEASFNLDSTIPPFNSVGEYYLTLEVWKDGKPYSKSIIFTVMP
jgi:uncharacterized repeat protein (TIGR02543 family)